ncbi:myocardial zonula adherens protein-like [Clytia hemisphaerica]|uniref:Cnidarian restricted protein n=1 Tax=Clytia hemisphaerica TaxID=252671 RepID=A0A7M5WUL6_9CNID
MLKLNLLVVLAVFFCIHVVHSVRVPAPVPPVDSLKKSVSGFQKEVEGFTAQLEDKKLTKDEIKTIIERLKQIKEILINFVTQIEQLIDQFAGSLFVKPLQQLLQLIKDLCEKIEQLLIKWNCLLKKKCLQNTIADLEASYNRIYNSIQNLKRGQCNGQIFSKRCISIFQSSKEQLTQIKLDIQNQITILNNLDCLTAAEKQECMDRLIKLQTKVCDLIKLIQKCLKKFFEIKINQMNALIQTITRTKILAQNANTKRELQYYINLLTGYQTELQNLKKEINTVQDCLKQVANCLTRADYQKCKEALDKLQEDLEKWCQIVKDCLEKLNKKMKVLCLEIDIEEKEQKIDELTRKYQSLLTGLRFDCDLFRRILNKLKELQEQLEACKQKLTLLYRQLNELRDCPEEYERLKARLDALKVKIEELCGNVSQMISFFQFLINFFCPRPTLGVGLSG